MIPDLSPLFHMLFFAIGFVPVIVLGALVSAFVAVPVWAVFGVAVGAGLGVNLWFARFG